jgi:hypothetical protein
VKTDVHLSPTDSEEEVAACDLITSLDINPRFHRDSRLGGIFHPGKVSYRELSALNSVHILIDGDHVSAHVDDVSPLVIRPDGSCTYAWGRVVAHNILVMLGDLGRRVRGLNGRQRCNLECHTEWVEEIEDTERRP